MVKDAYIVCKLSYKGLIFYCKLKVRIKAITVVILIMLVVRLYLKGPLAVVLLKRLGVGLLGVTQFCSTRSSRGRFGGAIIASLAAKEYNTVA